MHKNKYNRPMIRPVFWGALMALVIGLLLTALPSHQAEKTEEKTMLQATGSVAEHVAIPPIDSAAPSVFATASFGLGWFWGIESRFGIVDGVIRTRVGYGGGLHPDPTYRAIGDHTETVQIDYDPSTIDYGQLLELFWSSHEPQRPTRSRQYLHAIFYHDAAQQHQAEESKKLLEEKLGQKVHTPVLPLRSFTLAEDYHQKYLLKRHGNLVDELRAIYPDHADFVNSTAAARLNGYVGGHGSSGQLAKELEQLGLSPEARDTVTRFVGK